MNAINSGNLLKLFIFSLIILTLGMGFGRFLYTALLPLMLSEGIYNFQQLSYMASANYIGYLVGALLFTFSIFHKQKYQKFLLYYCLVSTCFFLFLMSLESNYILDTIVRFLAGISSAGAIIFGSSLILKLTSSKIIISSFFSGVGLGIFLGSEIVNVGLYLNATSSQLWFYISLISLGLAITALLLYPQKVFFPKNDQKLSNSSQPKSIISWVPLVILYGLAGFGYIITTTYLPVLSQGLGNVPIAKHLWAIVGIGAIFSCYCWIYLAEKFGNINALIANLLSQSVFVLLSYFDQFYFLLLISAFGVGITFMGTALLVMTIARTTTTPNSINLIGVVTFSYSIGQIVGPVLTSYVQAETNSIHLAILAAGSALCIAALIAKISKKKLFR